MSFNVVNLLSVTDAIKGNTNCKNDHNKAMERRRNIESMAFERQLNLKNIKAQKQSSFGAVPSSFAAKNSNFQHIFAAGNNNKEHIQANGAKQSASNSDVASIDSYQFQSKPSQPNSSGESSTMSTGASHQQQDFTHLGSTYAVALPRLSHRFNVCTLWIQFIIQQFILQIHGVGQEESHSQSCENSLHSHNLQTGFSEFLYQLS